MADSFWLVRAPGVKRPAKGDGAHVMTELEHGALGVGQLRTPKTNNKVNHAIKANT